MAKTRGNVNLPAEVADELDRAIKEGLSHAESRDELVLSAIEFYLALLKPRKKLSVSDLFKREFWRSRKP